MRANFSSEVWPATSPARNRAGIDHRIERTSRTRVETYRVEGITRWLDADSAKHVIFAIVGERHAIHERLRDRLNGEGLAGLANLIYVSIAGRDTDPKPILVSQRQLRNVGRNVAVLKGRALAVMA